MKLQTKLIKSVFFAGCLLSSIGLTLPAYAASPSAAKNLGKAIAKSGDDAVDAAGNAVPKIPNLPKGTPAQQVPVYKVPNVKPYIQKIPGPPGIPKAKDYIQKIPSPPGNPKPGGGLNVNKAPVLVKAPSPPPIKTLVRDTGASITSGKLRTDPNASAVYDEAITNSINLDRVNYFGGKKIVIDKFEPGVKIANLKLDKQLGAGGVATVFSIKGDKTRVAKIVNLGRTNNDLNGKKQILDQQVGRQMLSDIRSNSPNKDLFSIPRQDRLQIIEGPGGQKYAVSIEQNIGSPIMDPKTKTYLKGADGKYKKATNALDRLYERNGINPSKVKRNTLSSAEREKLKTLALSRDEELTVNIAIRDMNKRGIVWTDNKLENFDIVPDARSRTGYRAIFFDLDAFRPVKGKHASERFTMARKLQRAFDNAGPSSLPTQRQDNAIKNIVQEAQFKQLQSATPIPKHQEIRGLNDLLDETVFGANKIMGKDTSMGFLWSRNRNLRRVDMAKFNNFDDQRFNSEIFQISQKQPEWRNPTPIAGLKTKVAAGTTGAGVGSVAILGITGGTIYALDPEGTEAFVNEVLNVEVIP